MGWLSSTPRPTPPLFPPLPPGVTPTAFLVAPCCSGGAHVTLLVCLVTTIPPENSVVQRAPPTVPNVPVATNPVALATVHLTKENFYLSSRAVNLTSGAPPPQCHAHHGPSVSVSVELPKNGRRWSRGWWWGGFWGGGGEVTRWWPSIPFLRGSLHAARG